MEHSCVYIVFRCTLKLCNQSWLFVAIFLTSFFFPLQDQKLTRQEILDNWNMFVGSQATNYGEDLTKNHDEL